MEVEVFFIAMCFLVFALFLVARVFRGYQAVWLGMTLFAFGCCIVGLVGLVPRFSNYSINGFLGLPLDQPSWAWNYLKRFSLNDFLRFRLWSAIGYIVSVLDFSFSYATEKINEREKWFIGIISVILLLILWIYDPEQLFRLFKYGVTLASYPLARVRMERLLIIMDQLALVTIIFSLGYGLFKIFRLFYTCGIFQKRIQALLVGIGNAVLSFLFVILFATGRSSILNSYTMATTLLPLGKDYPFFDTTILQIVPFGFCVVLTVMLVSIFRYGFLGTWRLGTKDLEKQITVANQAVRMALHSFKNQFLGVQMAMDMAALYLGAAENETDDKVLTQINWAKDACGKALSRLDILQNQAQKLQVNPRWLLLTEIWEEAKQRLSGRLDAVNLVENFLTQNIYVWGDREHLVSVFENLLQNALDAIAEKECFKISPTITVTIGREYEWGFFRIEDNGVGIPKQNLQQIFSPFFTTKPAKNNWGLGLTYCHRVVKIHRGYINLQSRLGIGTTFEVVLRCRKSLNPNSRIFPFRQLNDYKKSS